MDCRGVWETVAGMGNILPILPKCSQRPSAKLVHDQAAWFWRNRENLSRPTLTTSAVASVVLANGGQFCRVFWQVGASATLGADTAFAGSILATTNITMETGASISGRALARNGAVTMDTNQIFDVRVAHDGSCVGPGSDAGDAGGGP